MPLTILTLNTGSNSLKFEIVSANPGNSGFGKSLLSGSYDDIGKAESKFSLLKNKRPFHEESIEVRNHGHATELLLDWIASGAANIPEIRRLSDIARVGHRVVHGGDIFDGPVLITDEVISQVKSLEELAPLHNASALAAIQAAKNRRSFDVPMIAVFDTVFHRTIPEKAAQYPIPPELARAHKIRRYGFHGLSHRYLSARYAEITGSSLQTSKLIALHLEGGSSAAAIRYGKSVDTSMGFTPLEGLMMGTRCGDIDPALVTYLMRKENMDPQQIEAFLNKRCGLLGVSSQSADTRELAKHADDKLVKLALDMFCYRVRKYIGAYLAVLEGADAIVLGGGIGENMPDLRERILEGFGWCGANLDVSANNGTVDREGLITTDDSRVAVWVIPTQEGLMLAKDVADYRLSA